MTLGLVCSRALTFSCWSLLVAWSRFVCVFCLCVVRLFRVCALPFLALVLLLLSCCSSPIGCSPFPALPLRLTLVLLRGPVGFSCWCLPPGIWLWLGCLTCWSEAGYVLFLTSLRLMATKASAAACRMSEQIYSCQSGRHKLQSFIETKTLRFCNPDTKNFTK